MKFPACASRGTVIQQRILAPPRSRVHPVITAEVLACGVEEGGPVQVAVGTVIRAMVGLINSMIAGRR
jgi:hypothetical protein